ncbi:MAG TPA: hypothetical protein PLG79_02000 [Spirochaetales bacterium]|nr:hypothetical protein [Spirochaetales bacterium]
MSIDRKKLRILPLLIVLVLFPGLRSVPVFGGEEKQVTIYVDASAREYGKSWKRQGTRSIFFREFSSTRTLETTDPDGILTAVLLDTRVEKALKQFLQGFQERWLEPAWYWQEVRGNRAVYTYYNPSMRIQISFSLEKPNSKILDLIDRTYARDPVNRKEVRDAYLNGYVIRIHSAENVLEPWLDTISFEEALIAATLIGNTFQPLLGIHDACGLLESLPGRVESLLSLTLVNYRPLKAEYEGEYRSFILRIHQMAGNLPRNLWEEAHKKIELSEVWETQLPEELLARKKGRKEDIVLLFYDVLTRLGYETCLLADRKTPAEDPILMTLYRTGGKGNWGALLEDRPVADVGADWRNVPAIVLGGEPMFVSLDVNKIFQQKRIDFPDSSQWSGNPTE